MKEHCATFGLNLPALLAACGLTAGCGGGPELPSELITNPDVVRILHDVASRPQSPPGFPELCREDANDFLDPAAVASFDAQVKDGSPLAPNIEGTWRSNYCITTSADTYPTTTECQGEVTWTGQGNGRITQKNMGEISSGEGLVSFIAAVTIRDTPGYGAVVVQSNHAVGAGCELDIINLIVLTPVSELGPQMRSINAVLTSTCAGIPDWSCSHGTYDR